MSTSRSRSRSMSKKHWSDIEEKGFTIYRSGVSVDSGTLNEMKRQINEKRDSSPIFNNAGRNDNKRIQCTVDMNKNNLWFMDTLQSFVNQINPLLTCSPWVVIHSKSGCLRQQPHLDYILTDDLRKLLDTVEKVPLLVLVALENNTYLDLWTQSPGIVQEKWDMMSVAESTIVDLSAGDILVFRADMIHAGSAYSSENTRLHAYLDSPFLKRDPNRTWIVKQHGSDYFKSLILEC